MDRYVATMSPPGHIEQLSSASWRVRCMPGTDPLTGRELRFRQTCKAHTNYGRFSVLQRGAHAPARQIPGPTDPPPTVGIRP